MASSQFDWSSMIYDVFSEKSSRGSNEAHLRSLPVSNTTSLSTSPCFSPLQYPKKESMSPLTTVTEEVWLDDLFVPEENGSAAGANGTSHNPLGTSHSSSHSLFSEQFLDGGSAATSFANSPLVKLEKESLADVPDLAPLDGSLSDGSRASSMDSMFQEIFSEEAGVGAGSGAAAGVGSVESSSNVAGVADTLNAAVKLETPQKAAQATGKPKKKRAPRKRLTEHQKQAHNKIEKRYRININLKIAGLQKIIPWLSGEKTAFEIGEGSERKEEEQDGCETELQLPRMNKSMILDKLTMYILYMQENERLLKMENEEMKRQLAQLGV